jgi:death on curing protein
VYYLTISDIILIQKELTLRYGGLILSENNIENESGLSYLIEAVSASIFGIELYPTIWEKAAIYMFSVNCDHIFYDGNKRTGLETALVFLEKNGHVLKDGITDDELTAFAYLVGNCQHDIHFIANWFSEKVA